MDIKSSKSIPVSEVHDILSKRKDDGELGYEQSQALEHSERFATVKSDQVKKIIGVLVENKKITTEIATKIVDVWPSNSSTLKAILVKDRIELSDDEIASVLKELA